MSVPGGRLGFGGLATRMKSDSDSGGDKGGDGVGDGGGRSPLELLCRLFPHMKREVLQASLENCQHDILLTMETILNQHNHPRSLATSFLTGMAPRPALTSLGGAGLMSGHVVTSQSSTPPLASLGLLAPSYLNPSLGLSGGGFKSAFSPITQPPTAHLNSIRYMYAAAAAASGRNVTLLPYSPLLPNLTARGYGYS